MAQTPIKELTQKFHHNQILSKCKHLFYNRQLENVTSDEISQYAGYSKRTVYVYFKSKDDIYSQITAQSIEFFSDRMRETEFINLAGFLYFLSDFKENYEYDFYYLLKKRFNKSDESDYFTFGEKFRPFIDMLADKHNFIYTSLDVPLLAWNCIVYSFENGLHENVCEEFILRGLAR